MKEAITIEFIQRETTEENIDVRPGNGWCVKQGDRMADCLSFDEMLGTVVSLTMPEGARPCLTWMKTDEQHQRWLEYLRNTKTIEPVTEVEFEEKPFGGQPYTGQKE